MSTVLRRNNDKMESSGERREELRESIYIFNRGCVKGLRREDWNLGCRREESERIGLADAKGKVVNGRTSF